MDSLRNPKELTYLSNNSEENQEQFLWEKYLAMIQSITSFYSQSWRSEKIEAFENQQRENKMSKTKKAFQVLKHQAPKMKLKLLNRVIKNLNQARIIEDQMANMIQQMLRIYLNWNDWIAGQKGKQHMKQVFGSNQKTFDTNQNLQSNMFEIETDHKSFKKFKKFCKTGNL